MKKFSIFLLMALVTGMLSAFTHSNNTALTDAYGYVDGTWVAVDRSEVGVTFICEQGGTYCLYNTQNFNDPVIETEGTHFELIP